MPDWVAIGLGVFTLVCFALPPRLDPAIRIKMWLDGHDDDDGPWPVRLWFGIMAASICFSYIVFERRW